MAATSRRSYPSGIVIVFAGLAWVATVASPSPARWWIAAPISDDDHDRRHQGAHGEAAAGASSRPLASWVGARRRRR